MLRAQVEGTNGATADTSGHGLLDGISDLVVRAEHGALGLVRGEVDVAERAVEAIKLRWETSESDCVQTSDERDVLVVWGWTRWCHRMYCGEVTVQLRAPAGKRANAHQYRTPRPQTRRHAREKALETLSRDWTSSLYCSRSSLPVVAPAAPHRISVRSRSP